MKSASNSPPVLPIRHSPVCNRSDVTRAPSRDRSASLTRSPGASLGNLVVIHNPLLRDMQRRDAPDVRLDFTHSGAVQHPIPSSRFVAAFVQSLRSRGISDSSAATTSLPQISWRTECSRQNAAISRMPDTASRAFSDPGL